ncbi:MAG TPA: hypothetical protein PKN04_06740 [bacterium]|jgi:hypothetical protein|nr:hypothetical protein [bacterium]HNT65459.1 hypothetical protein [bacterium]
MNRIFGFFALLFTLQAAQADVLITVDKQKFIGRLSLIAHEYIEFENYPHPGEKEWLKVYKKDLLAIVDDRGKIIYPRDKFDENALNWGKVRLRSDKEKKIYEERQMENNQQQVLHESQEKSKYRVAAVIGGLSGLMLYAFLDGR